jgi:hypothetical protein
MPVNRRKKLQFSIITAILILFITVESLFLIKAFHNKQSNDVELKDLQENFDYLSKEYLNTENEISKYQSEIKNNSFTK